ncbi:alcohol oxidase [Russula dissimulans]|nr:alcohol oxidase [Russula dissimulans]
MLATIDQVSDKSFDYVVIGGGTTGLVVATRLSEDPSVSVLVLEAGASNLNDPAILIPGNHTDLLRKPQYDWIFQLGKGLGGSSSINFFLFHLPPAADIDAFEKLGNKGWNWETLKKYYTKIEQFHPPQVKDDLMRFDIQEHGLEGPLEVGFPLLQAGYEKPFAAAIQTLGFAGDNTGTWLTPLTISPKTRTRAYAANMYYEPHASRNNLVVLTSAHVTRVSLSEAVSEDATAESVSFIHEGKEYRAHVKKEVIVSAGAIMSPQILELSGIGDPDVLQKAGVKVSVDLRGVGTNVQEHCNVGLVYQVKEELQSDFLTFDCFNDPDELRKQTELYHAGEKGVFDTKSSLMTFVPLSAISPDAQAVQEKYLAPIRTRINSGDYAPGLLKQYKLQLENIKAQIPGLEVLIFPSIGLSLPPDPKRKYASLLCMLNKPFSRGTIHINSSNPVNTQQWTLTILKRNMVDAQCIVETVKFVRRLAQQEPLKSVFTGKSLACLVMSFQTDSFVSSVDEERFPGPAVQTDEEILKFVREKLFTTFHTVGSCSMLPREDGGVVDNKLKVYGTSNIRVMDISVVPLHLAGHIQTTAYAIGELGADIIRGRVDF